LEAVLQGGEVPVLEGGKDGAGDEVKGLVQGEMDERGRVCGVVQDLMVTAGCGGDGEGKGAVRDEEKVLGAYPALPCGAVRGGEGVVGFSRGGEPFH
jgi:hypothetical protein